MPFFSARTSTAPRNSVPRSNYNLCTYLLSINVYVNDQKIMLRVSLTCRIRGLPKVVNISYNTAATAVAVLLASTRNQRNLESSFGLIQVCILGDRYWFIALNIFLCIVPNFTWRIHPLLRRQFLFYLLLYFPYL